MIYQTIHQSEKEREETLISRKQADIWLADYTSIHLLAEIYILS